MPLQVRESIQDVATTGQWVMTVNGTEFATFISIGGFSRSTGTVTRYDGGTGQPFNFTDQTRNYGALTLTRVYDPSDAADSTITNFVTDCIENGTKFDGELTKFHHQDVLHRIRFKGLLFTSESHPTQAKGGAAAYTQTYAVSVDFWEQVTADA